MCLLNKYRELQDFLVPTNSSLVFIQISYGVVFFIHYLVFIIKSQ